MCPGGENQTSRAIAEAMAAAKVNKPEPPSAANPAQSDSQTSAGDASTRAIKQALDNAAATSPAVPTDEPAKPTSLPAEPIPPIAPAATSAIPTRRAPTKAVRLQPTRVAQAQDSSDAKKRNKDSSEFFTQREIGQAITEAKKQLEALKSAQGVRSSYELARSDSRIARHINELTARNWRDLVYDKHFPTEEEVREAISENHLMNRLALRWLASQHPDIQPYTPTGDSGTDRATINKNSVIIFTIAGSFDIYTPGFYEGEATNMWRPIYPRLKGGENLQTLMNQGTYRLAKQDAKPRGTLAPLKNCTVAHGDKEFILTPLDMWISKASDASMRNFASAYGEVSQRIGNASMRAPRTG